MSQFIRLLFFLAIPIYFGFVFTRKILKESVVYLLIPLCVVLGFSVYLFLLNLLSYLIPFRFSVFIVLGLVFLGSFLLDKIVKTDKRIEMGLSKEIQVALGLTLLGITGLVAFVSLFSHFYDVHWHFPLVSTITDGNFPPLDPFHSTAYATYHYAIDLLMAAIHIVSGIPIWFCNDVCLMLFGPLTFLLVFGLVKRYTQSSLIAYLCSILFFYGGGLRWLSYPRYISEAVKSWVLLELTLDKVFQFFHQIVLNITFFHGGITSSFSEHMFHYPSVLATPLYLAITFLFLKERKEYTGRSALFLGVLLGFLCLVREDIFGLMMIAMGIFGIRDIFKKKNKRGRIIGWYFSLFLIAILLALFQGGAITGALLHPQENVSLLNSSFSVRECPGFPSWWRGFIPIGSKGWFKELIQEFGFSLILFPLACLYLIRKKNVLGIFFLFFSIIGFLIPTFIKFESPDIDIARFYNLPAMALAVGLFLGGMIKEAKGKIKWVLVYLSFIIIILGSIMPVIGPLVSIQDKWHRWHWVLNQEDILAGDWMRQHLPQGSVVYGISPAYSGLYTFGGSSHRPEDKEKIEKALERLDISKMRDLGVDYLWIEPQRLEPKKGYFEPLYELKGSKKKLFRIRLRD